MEGIQLNIPRRLTMVRIITTVMLLVSMLCAWRLWFTQRLFPAAPLVEGAGPLNEYVLYLGITACVALAGSLILKWYRLLIMVALLCILAMVAADYNRITQWSYVYVSVLMVLIFYNGRVDDPNRYTSYFIILQLLVCSVYLYTGIHQLQQRFITHELAEAISPLRSILSERQFGFLLKLGWSVPFLTIFAAAALFIVPLRYLGITLAVLLHVSLVLLVWPLRNGDLPGYLLNFFMIPVVLLLFSGRTRQRYFSPVFLFQRPAFYIVIAAFWILPAFNNSERWPDACSANVYSGNRNEARFVLPVAAYLRMPLFVKNFCKPYGAGLRIDHQRWSSYELGLTVTDERPVLEALKGQLEFWNRGPVKDMTLTVVPKEKLLVMP